MQSWTLKNFVKDKGMNEAMRVTTLTTKAGVYYAYERGIQITQTEDHYYEVWIKQLQRRVPIEGES